MKLHHLLISGSLAAAACANAADPVTVTDDLSQYIWATTNNITAVRGSNTTAIKTASTLYTVLSTRNAMTWYWGAPTYGGAPTYTQPETGLSINVQYPKNDNGQWMAVKSNLLAADTFSTYESVSLSFDIAQDAMTSTGLGLFAQLYYLESGTTTLSLLGSATLSNITTVSQHASIDLSAAGLETINKAGQFYFVMGNQSGSAWTTMTIQNMKLEGSYTETAPVPEPATASLALAGLAGMMVRRRRK